MFYALKKSVEKDYKKQAHGFMRNGIISLFLFFSLASFASTKH
jgi:hypothetical protein